MQKGRPCEASASTGAALSRTGPGAGAPRSGAAPWRPAAATGGACPAHRRGRWSATAVRWRGARGQHTTHDPRTCESWRWSCCDSCARVRPSSRQGEGSRPGPPSTLRAGTPTGQALFRHCTAHTASSRWMRFGDSEEKVGPIRPSGPPARWPAPTGLAAFGKVVPDRRRVLPGRTRRRPDVPRRAPTARQRGRSPRATVDHLRHSVS